MSLQYFCCSLVLSHNSRECVRVCMHAHIPRRQDTDGQCWLVSKHRRPTVKSERSSRYAMMLIRKTVMEPWLSDFPVVGVCFSRTVIAADQSRCCEVIAL